MTDLLDGYGRRAWLMPGLLVTSPLNIAAVLVVTQQPTWWKSLAGSTTIAALILMAATLIRTHGQRSEPALWAAWDRPPTTRLLRWRDSANPVLTARRHQLLARLGHELPDRAAEADDPEQADHHYATAVMTLRERTRDSGKFPRVATENADYGFRRNVLACRPFGLAISTAVIVLAVAAAVLPISAPQQISLNTWRCVAAAGLSLAIGLGWYRAITTVWVAAAADAYAERLLGSLEILAEPSL